MAPEADFAELMENLRQINELCNIQDMLQKSRKLLAKLKEATSDSQKTQAFLEVLSEAK